ncbi:hypothetical protein E2C01_050354 [Portunus trituberculatus]|uniref:Uncharacterized protein n=1 Tax=Portunus trituberculatus TaxID=210409 RepID=A0A5B7GIP6_PORTR|nr:hypothetical protein [Portunus trituberculatus]
MVVVVVLVMRRVAPYVVMVVVVKEELGMIAGWSDGGVVKAQNARGKVCERSDHRDSQSHRKASHQTVLVFSALPSSPHLTKASLLHQVGPGVATSIINSDAQHKHET